VNFTIEDNFTCPKGKLSFSVFSVKDNTLNAFVSFFAQNSRRQGKTVQKNSRPIAFWILF